MDKIRNLEQHVPRLLSEALLTTDNIPNSSYFQNNPLGLGILLTIVSIFVILMIIGIWSVCTTKRKAKKEEEIVEEQETPGEEISILLKDDLESRGTCDEEPKHKYLSRSHIPIAYEPQIEIQSRDSVSKEEEEIYQERGTIEDVTAAYDKAQYGEVPNGTLENVGGNVTFANAVLQCLMHTKDFVDVVMKEKNANNMVPKDLFQFAMRYMQSDTRASGRLLSTLYAKWERFSPSRESDPADLFDVLYTLLVRDSSQKKAYEDLFKGVVKTQIVCTQCGRECHKTELLPILNVVSTLYNKHNMLNLFRELSTDLDCQECQEYTVHMEVTTLERLPSILVIKIDSMDDIDIFTTMIIPDLRCKASEETYVKYGFYAAVLGKTDIRGGQYQAIVKDDRSPNLFWNFVDNQEPARKKLSDLGYYPKLLFYKLKNGM
jgi:hypothetical protein